MHGSGMSAGADDFQMFSHACNEGHTHLALWHWLPCSSLKYLQDNQLLILKTVAIFP